VVAQVIEFLTSKPKALKIPVPPKKKRKELKSKECEDEYQFYLHHLRAPNSC
jgi:hypothetical protein